MIARRSFSLNAALPVSLTLALALGATAQPALARAKAKPKAVEAAVTKAHGDSGVALAEASVAQSPRDASLRAALGRVYLKNGRFQSATTALSDAVALGDASGRTLLALALAQIGNGQNNAALATLESGNNVIPVADLGLALALAGEGDKGSVLLADALRAGDKSDKLRANLAYAYALAGRWAESRTIVAMDLPADKVDGRMTEWAAAARPEASRQRVASLLGVEMANDAGQPMQLALNKSESPVQMAAAEAAPMAAPAVAAAAPVETPAETPVNPAPTESASAEAPVQSAPVQSAPVASAESAPAAELPALTQTQPAAVAETIAPPAPVFHAIPVPVSTARPVALAVHTPRAKVRFKTAPATETASPDMRGPSGTHVVQLGAFLSEKNAMRAKKAFLSREKSFAAADVEVTKAMIEDRQFWRVSVRGFNASAATSKCAAIRKSGGACFAHAGNLPQTVPAQPAQNKASGNSQGAALALASPKGRGR
ncbi:tetratricopeptide repeat protein [Novosphingobium sp. KACC 22771]|uniref:tetratricopeptide repeat protein n=1 Tax=Novosphingobium sp. KACC 22771 TaxID=3025670 RepID=UPI002365829D|nr:SPOR domain-containing protein [Novosphingobium sp. KACC 22771]WDF73521.1 SPOR domain-containing protein [Novosphingobium sp. KACC 22771]